MNFQHGLNSNKDVWNVLVRLSLLTEAGYPEYGTSHPSVIASVLVGFLCLSFNRREYNAIAWKMKDLLIYTWKTILCGSSTGLSAELCVYIAFKGLDLPAPAVSLQTPNSLKPVRAGDFSGPTYRMPIQLVSSIHLMRRGEEESPSLQLGEFVKPLL